MQPVSALDGIEVRARFEGGRTPIVFVHGAMDRSAAFLRVSRFLAAHPVLIYDRRGYGRSVLPDGTGIPGVLEHVDDLLTIVEFFTAATGRAPILFGHSLGGTFAVLAAAQQPASTAGLVVFESPLFWENWWPDHPDSAAQPRGAPIDEVTEGARTAESFMRRMIGDGPWESLPDRTRFRRLEEGRILRAELTSCRALDVPNLEGVSAPAIVAVGSDADVVRQRAAAVLSAALPSARSVTIAGAPHNFHTSDPERFGALVELLDPEVGPDRSTIA